MSAEAQRTCPSCGNKLPATMKFCPLCMLRKGFAGAMESSESTLEEAVKTIPQQVGQQFEHYELVKGEDGNPVELGRGAMGVTYKAFDVNLHCLVTLKVISERYLGDDSARLRFLREARAAASVRDPNVASVFHLGKSGENYFYAMEFVQGETLERLIKSSGQLKAKLALEIVTQVAAGLAAVHEQNLVHRDIKPSNIMVRLKDDDSITAKIIDLGLAKTVDESVSEVAISWPGTFAGTPEFASPEQFAGVGVDIRSDLYSLGVTLWFMLTGRTPFRGRPAEVMYQHQHAPLPLERLKDVPQPVVVLLEKLLEKDAAQRFQNPAELMKAVPTIADAMVADRRITRRNLQEETSPSIARRKPGRQGPKKISIARLPVTGSDLFGREEDIAFLDRAWANKEVNVATIVAWAGGGKSTLINHWLRRMAADHYRSAELIFGWSFYRQGTSGETSSADELLDAALAWFGDPDPRLGTGWQRGERLAKLVASRRTLLVLDGLEPLQNPPGSQEGRFRDPALQALLRELAAFNKGLCVITTRIPVADIADFERTCAPRRELEHLSGDAGAKLLRALGVEGSEVDLRIASEEFAGHCLALTLLGSYLSDAYSGDIRRRTEVTGRLAQDVRQGAHARKVMESYQGWFGEGPEVSVLRMLGLFDRPADEKALEVLLKPPAIRGLTESLAGLSPTEWRTILGKLRRARLLAPEDPHHPGCLDTHPLVREYFGGQLRSRRTDAWKECNRRLYHYCRAVAPELPNNFREMEPLFLAVIFGCHAGLFREALHEVYIPRIQRGDAYFAANVLSARGALLTVLAHFFEQGRWGTLVETNVEQRSLSTEDRVYLLLQAALYLTVTKETQAPEVRLCYERAEELCLSLNRPKFLFLYSALVGRWRYSLMSDKLSRTLELAEEVHLLAQARNDSALLIGAYDALGATLLHLGDFERARRFATCGVEIWRSRAFLSGVEELMAPAIACLCIQAETKWHFGEIASCRGTLAEAKSLAKKLNDVHGLVQTLSVGGFIAYCEREASEVQRLASEMLDLSTRHNFAFFRSGAAILRGWAQSALGETTQGVLSIEHGLEAWRGNGVVINLSFWLALKAEALHLAGLTLKSLETLTEAEEVIQRSEERYWSAELYRLRGVFLAAIGSDKNQIESSFRAAIKTAQEQRSISLVGRAKESYAEWRRQKASGSGDLSPG
jgi:serine/threonine protein kinase/tetratricopeptide (TPR) repeat protein